MATVQTPQEQRLVLHNIDWETYERLLAAHESSSVPHFTYDRGELEIVSPLPKHDRYAHTFELLVPVAAGELGVHVYGLRSTTFKREDLQCGAEPDSCFYLENRDRIRGKDRIILGIDPPPDLVVEVEITHPAISKLPIYAQFGVPEVWRYDGERLRILLLEGDRYAESALSRALPGVPAVALSALIQEIEWLDDLELIDRVRDWARGLGCGKSDEAPPSEER